MRVSPVAFLDFEASSLDPDSWPIEIGLSWIEDGDIRTTSSLIKPEPSWSEGAWSPISQKIHGIPREYLDNAAGAQEVAREYKKRLARFVVCSDAPQWDGMWLSRLLSADPEDGREESTNPINIINLFTHGYQSMGGQAAVRMMEILRSENPPHRAGPDSERMAKAWIAAHKEVFPD